MKTFVDHYDDSQDTEYLTEKVRETDSGVTKQAVVRARAEGLNKIRAVLKHHGYDLSKGSRRR